MKPRNPVAGNSWRYNKPKIIKDKKKETLHGKKHTFIVIDEYANT